MTTKEKAIELCDIIYHSSMGNGWDIFIKNRACKIVDEIISACEYNRVESYNTDWWNKVKEEIVNL